MKFKIGQSLTLLLVLGVACPTAALGTESDQSQPAAANDQSNGEVSSIDPAALLTVRELEAIFVTDDAHDSLVDGVSPTGWRTSSNGPADVDIKFIDDNPSTATAEAEEAAEVVSAEQPADSVEARMLGPLLSAERLPPIKQDENLSTPAAEAQEPAPLAMGDNNVQLAARMFADEDDLPSGLNDAPSALPSYSAGPLDRNQPIVRNADYGSCDSSCGCGDALCDSYCETGYCETEYCPPQPVLFWTAGVEATFLFPDINSEGASFLVEEASENRSDWFSTITDDVDSMYVSPRIWLGIQGCKWGANLRYWHMQAGEGSYEPTVDGMGGWNYGSWTDIGFSTINHLEAYTIDLEITRRFCLNDCWMQASAGLRHAEIEQDESIWGAALTDDATLMGVARANRQSRGTGVVLGLYGRKPLFPCSCVHWFYNVRWSAMWGPTETSAETGVLLAATPGMGVVANAGSNNGASTWADDTLYVGEIQFGLEWDYALQCLPANAFFRAAVEYQRWDGGVGYSSATSFANVVVSGTEETYAETNASAAGAELDLVGLSISTGLTW